mmetsp:Transcript_4283/g.10710  ORF Transcript_4283/g.10710 Transcript_4283/m.10710 type:complete len:481 (-) Transcript_4283:595-2037(-)
MKLSIATATLVSSASAAAASSTVGATSIKKAGSGSSSSFPSDLSILDKKQQIMDKFNMAKKSSQVAGAKNARSKMKSQLQQKLLAKNVASSSATTQLVNDNDDNNKVECDPTAPAAADLGVLSCGGLTQYCMESNDSSLGGYIHCSVDGESNNNNKDEGQQQRQRGLDEDVVVPISEGINGDGALIDYLEYICNATSPEDATELGLCDCTIDADAYEGVAVCESDAESYSFETICGSQLPNVTFTYNVQYTLDVTAEETGSAQVCYQLSQPATIEYCYTYSVSPTEDSSCTKSLNGVDCNSCVLFSQNATNPVTGEDYTLQCHEFDCTNTDFPVEGSLCGDSTLSSYIFTDILVYGYLPCPDACFLCGSEGLYTSTPTAPFLGDNNTCGLVELAALAGYPVVAQYCDDISTDFQASCSCTSVRSLMLLSLSLVLCLKVLLYCCQSVLTVLWGIYSVSNIVRYSLSLSLSPSSFTSQTYLF